MPEAEVPMTPEEMGLLEAIHANPRSASPRLVYADWLEDHGSSLAPYVRAEYELIALPPGDQRFDKGLDRLEQIVRSSGTPLGGWEHALTLERLKSKIERLRDLDTQCKVFGARVHKYRLAPPLAETELLGLERRLGFLLPSEHRAFVLRTCNGHVGPGYGLEPLAPTTAPATLAEPCPLTDADAEAVLKEMRSSEPQEWPDLSDSPPGTLLLAETGGGGTNFLVLSGQQRGKVWAVGEFTAPDVDLGDFTPHGFFSWYEDWLDTSLARRFS
jgi:uncharacterized protein (TIGR02996 family)